MARPAFVVELQAYLGLRRKARSVSITIDAGRLLIQLNVSDAELAKRRQAWTPRAPRYTRGVLAKYAKLVSSAGRGAVTD
jgi:dihydroxy-acid dehydratase